MIPHTCIIDCRQDIDSNIDFLNLCLWGKYTFEYPIEEVIKSEIFNSIYLLTDSMLVKKLAGKKYGEVVKVVNDWSELLDLNSPFMLLSGRAVMIKKESLVKSVSEFDGNCLVSAKSVNVIDFKRSDCISFLAGSKTVETNAFAIYKDTSSMKNCDMPTRKEYLLNDAEALVVNNSNDFELALILLKQENQKMVYEEIVLNRIKEKEHILKNSENKNSVCFIGHSQLDYWNIDSLGSRSVRNCGILAIDSKQYFDYILAKDDFCYDSEYFVFMLGTNDITSESNLSIVVKNIKRVIGCVATKAPAAKLLFLACAHVLCRMDRDNRTIDRLNMILKKELGSLVTWIDTTFLDDDTGSLDQINTVDGLHFSETAYKKLQTVLETIIK